MDASRAAPHRSGQPAAVRRGSALGLVALGGAVGTLVRYGLGLWWHDAAVTTIVVNLVGAFVLGALVTTLGRIGVSSRNSVSHKHGAVHQNIAGHQHSAQLQQGARAERLRLLLGTGMLGGFTTYSGLALETGQLALAGHEFWAIGYAGLTLIAGLAASLLGIWVGDLGQPNESGTQ